LIYLDTSVLAKRYYREPDSERFQELSNRLNEIATASLSYAEFFSGLSRKLRLREIDRQRYDQAARAFDRDWTGFTLVRLSDDILRRARAVIERHALRAGDGVQLASALVLAASLRIEFASADQRLSQAARDEGLVTL
jgi:predicted nucleic acid-binding protein